MSKNENHVLTGHIRSDIIVLSSVLNGMQVNTPSLPRDKTDDKLCLLSYISTILTISDDNSPVAHSVHAVSGRINVDTIECLVCAENTGQSKTAPADPDNAERGAKLLRSWNLDFNDDLKKRNYTLKEQLRDVFQILSYLRSNPLDSDAPSDFMYLIHSQAFRKLKLTLQVILEFSTRAEKKKAKYWDTRFLDDLQFPSHLEHLRDRASTSTDQQNDTSAEREKGRKVEVMGEVNKHNNESDEDKDNDQTDDLFPAALLNLSSKSESAKFFHSVIH
ncbi:hypothetical protein F5050DRAFT_1794982 [Lentinula boryana]|uniref:Uncharacterized protein n=1 Tax=Lentinula boryana TaxID=40481 RepID=A0ABQ8PZX9_9AGAR|nr:hypothetical protein F5050DRAFT_1794982 [Lentinula boryana]